MNSKFEDRLRIAAKKSCGTMRALADKSGVSERRIASWLAGTEPKINALTAVAAAADVSLDWLATGEGPMRRSPEPVEEPAADDQAGETANPSDKASAVDLALMGRCGDALGKVYKELNIRLSDGDLSRLAGEIYNSIIASGFTDPELQRDVIKALAARHRREILAEHAANRHGKQSAS